MSIKLTQTVQKGGCAAKIPATVLRESLSSLYPQYIDDARYLGGSENFDDASIFKLNDQTALVETLDFFTPVVDSPNLFGRVAAANALSDVFAMGADPITCLAILAFPLATLDTSIMTEIMKGAVDVVADAGARVVGGHSIDDDTIKFGLSVSGLVHPDKIWTNGGISVGDKLILTKPLGTGSACAALKRKLISERDLKQVTDSMATLNRVKDLLSDSQLAAIHGATDVTGYGLLGHAMEMSLAANCSIIIDSQNVPYFEPCKVFLNEEVLTKAHHTNRAYTESLVDFRADLENWRRLLLYDPQTSGGLILSVSEDEAESTLVQLRSRFATAEIIGEVSEQGHPGIYVY